MQSPFAKSLDRCFLDFFANTRMQRPYAKQLGMLLVFFLNRMAAIGINQISSILLHVRLYIFIPLVQLQVPSSRLYIE
jgi:hypothetical protein